jgi:hypothetical protein
MTADNASSNNVQAAALYTLENSFEESNHIRCFNYTIQLSGKALIQPFNTGMSKADSGLEKGDGDIPNLEDFDCDEDANEDSDAGDLSEDHANLEDAAEFDMLSEDEQMCLLDDTSTVHETVSKVRVKFNLFLVQFVSLAKGLLHDTLAETCYLYAQNLPTIVTLLPHAGLALALLLLFFNPDMSNMFCSFDSFLLQ